MHQIGVEYTIQRVVLLIHLILKQASINNYPVIAIMYINTRDL